MIVREGSAQLLIRIHHKRSGTSDWLSDPFSRDQKKTSGPSLRLDTDLIPRSCDDEVARLYGFSIPNDPALVEVAQAVHRGPDRMSKLLVRGKGYIKINNREMGVGRSSRSVELSGNHLDSPFSMRNDRDLVGRNVLVTWIDHLQTRREIDPQLKSPEESLVLLRHLTVNDTRPAVIHWTDPGTRKPSFPLESLCRKFPCFKYVTVSKPRWGWEGKPAM